MSDISPTPALFGEVKLLIESSRQRVAVSINAELTQLYWRVGRAIGTQVLGSERGAYGERVVPALATALTQEFGKGWSSRHLYTCVQMAEVFADEAIVHTLCAQLSWSHFKLLLAVAEPLKRDFYAQLAAMHRWSVRELARQLDAMLYERTAISRQPEAAIAQELAGLRDTGQLSPDLVFKDSYVLDFLGLTGAHSEATLEQAIVGRVQEFILELGQGFAFLERQKRISVDDTDYYLDLLFYHRPLRRLVAIDLKIGKFRPEYKGQMELYLRWLDRHDRPAGELPPVGLLLCSEGNTEHIELLLLDQPGEVRVAQYLTELPPKAWFERQLHRAIELARQQLDHP